MGVMPAMLRRKLVLGVAIVLCVIGVVVLGDALIGSFPGPGEQAQTHTRLIVIGLVITAVGGLLIGWVTLKVRR
jgi:hypothetical protein